MTRRLMTLRTLYLLSLAALSGCAPESTSPVDEPGADGIRAIHIAHNGQALDTILRTGVFGELGLSLLLEGEDGTLRPLTDERGSWGSTHPAVMDLSDHAVAEVTGPASGQVFFSRRNEGRARVIASLGPFRDTVTVEVRRVPTRIRLDVDTMVTLAPNAVNLTGSLAAYHTFLFRAVRTDSSGAGVSSTAPITWVPVGDAPFDVFAAPRGDTVAIAGTRTGDGAIAVHFAGRVDTLPVQVADTYRVVRLTLGPAGNPRPLSSAITIPAGAAIIFRNDTPFMAGIISASVDRMWQVSPILPGGMQAQRFDTPGEYPFYWGDARATITVTAPPAPSP